MAESSEEERIELRRQTTVRWPRFRENDVSMSAELALRLRGNGSGRILRSVPEDPLGQLVIFAYKAYSLSQHKTSLGGDGQV